MDSRLVKEAVEKVKVLERTIYLRLYKLQQGLKFSLESWLTEQEEELKRLERNRFAQTTLDSVRVSFPVCIISTLLLWFVHILKVTCSNASDTIYTDCTWSINSHPAPNCELEPTAHRKISLLQVLVLFDDFCSRMPPVTEPSVSNLNWFLDHAQVVQTTAKDFANLRIILPGTAWAQVRMQGRLYT